MACAARDSIAGSRRSCYDPQLITCIYLGKYGLNFYFNEMILEYKPFPLELLTFSQHHLKPVDLTTRSSPGPTALRSSHNHAAGGRHPGLSALTQYLISHNYRSCRKETCRRCVVGGKLHSAAVQRPLAFPQVPRKRVQNLADSGSQPAG